MRKGWNQREIGIFAKDWEKKYDNTMRKLRTRGNKEPDLGRKQEETKEVVFQQYLFSVSLSAIDPDRLQARCITRFGAKVNKKSKQS